MSANAPILRNLTEPQPLDVESESQRLMMTLGIVQSACFDTPRDTALDKSEVWDVLWRRVPFIKALNDLARNHPAETRVLWKRALQEPMPFGGAPLGLPEGEEP